MMFSDTFNFDDHFTSRLLELAQDPNHLPPTSTVCDAPPAITVTPSSPSSTAAATMIYDAPANTEVSHKHSIMIEDDFPEDECQPPTKKMRTATGSKPFHRIPCKARGMSNEHNSDTAFIDIPVDAPHGLLLSCSSAECAQAGRKFRYCKVCAHPVAKRNFPKRHGHGLIESADDLKQVDYASTFIDPTEEEGIMKCQPCAVPASAEVVTIAPQVTRIEKPRHHRRVVSIDQFADLPSSVGQMAPSTAAPPVVTMSKPKPKAVILSAGEADWLSLLKEKPKIEEDTKMSTWMNKIISFSEDDVSSSSEESNEEETGQAEPVVSTGRTTMVSPHQIEAEPLGNVSFFPVDGRSSSEVMGRRSSFEMLDSVFASVDMSNIFS